MIPRSQVLATLPFGLILLAMFVYSLEQRDVYSYGTELISLVLLAVPVILAWREVIDLPWPITLSIGLALSLHSFGLVTQWYNTTDWWGYLTHFVSGIVVASLVATLMLIVINYDTGLKMPVRWVPFFIFISVLALEGFWKIFEFTADHTLGTMMQHGLDDTMNDNFSDTVAGIVAGLGAAYYIGHASIKDFVAGLKLEKSEAWFRKRRDTTR